MPNPLDCSDVSTACPVEASIYGYYPSLPANAFFLAIFATCLTLNAAVGTYAKTWTYAFAMTLGCLAEVIGYAGRIIMNNNPFDQVGFEMQICCLTLAPAFNSAAVYLTLKHITLCFGPDTARIRPKFYTWGFVSTDILALVFQGAGGGIAGSAGDNNSLRGVGTDLMMVGICLQVATLVVFGILNVDFVLQRQKDPMPLSSEAKNTLESTKFRLYAAGLLIAYLAILTRCVYRIAEMAGGWSNPIMQDQDLFIGLDSTLVVLATLLQTLLHPGFFFPRLSASFTGPIENEKLEGYTSSLSESKVV